MAGRLRRRYGTDIRQIGRRGIQGRRDKCTVTIDLNAHIVERFDKDDMVMTFFTDLRREENVEALLNKLRREYDEGHVFVR